MPTIAEIQHSSKLFSRYRRSRAIPDEMLEQQPRYSCGHRLTMIPKKADARLMTRAKNESAFDTATHESAPSVGSLVTMDAVEVESMTGGLVMKLFNCSDICRKVARVGSGRDGWRYA